MGQWGRNEAVVVADRGAEEVEKSQAGSGITMIQPGMSCEPGYKTGVHPVSADYVPPRRDPVTFEV